MRYLFYLLVIWLLILPGCAADTDASVGPGPDDKDSHFQLIINNTSQHTLDEIILHTRVDNYKTNGNIIVQRAVMDGEVITFDRCEYADDQSYYLTVVRMNASTDQRKIAITTGRSFSFGRNSGKLTIDVYGSDFTYDYSKNTISGSCQ